MLIMLDFATEASEKEVVEVGTCFLGKWSFFFLLLLLLKLRCNQPFFNFLCINNLLQINTYKTLTGHEHVCIWAITLKQYCSLFPLKQEKKNSCLTTCSTTFKQHKRESSNRCKKYCEPSWRMERSPNPIYFTRPYFREPTENIKNLVIGDWMKPSVYQHFSIKVKPAGNSLKQKKLFRQ